MQGKISVIEWSQNYIPIGRVLSTAIYKDLCCTIFLNYIKMRAVDNLIEHCKDLLLT